MHLLLQLPPGLLRDRCSIWMNYKRTCNPHSSHTAANLPALPAQADVHLCLAIKATQTQENRNSNRASWLVRVNHPRCGHVPESSYKLSHSANSTPAAWHHQQGPRASRKAVRMLPAGAWEALGKRDPSSLLTGSTRPACCTHSPGLLNDGLIFLPMLFLKDTRARNFHSTMEHNHF